MSDVGNVWFKYDEDGGWSVVVSEETVGNDFLQFDDAWNFYVSNDWVEKAPVAEPQ